MKVNAELITGWRTATKVCGILAKHVSDAVDKVLIDKMYLQTLEGNEALKADAMVCKGEAGDVWMQAGKKLFAKYTAINVTPDGWIEFIPKPENEVNAIECTHEWRLGNAIIPNPCVLPAANDEMYKIADFYINGQWGDDNYPAFGKSVQWGHNGDFICQNKTDLTDVWIVKRRLFLNTYQFKT